MAALNVGLGNSVGGTSGCGTGVPPARTRPAPPRPRPARRAGRASAPRSPSPVSAVGQRAQSEHAPSTVPAMSSPGADSGRGSPARAAARSTTTSAASGRLIRNTARQLHSTSQPPRNGPMAPAMPPSPDQAPIAAARSGAVERRRDQREAARGEQRAADALQGPGRDQLLDVRGQPADQRGEREPHDPDQEHPPPAEVVAQRAAEQDQRGERERVGVDRPLQAGEPGAELGADAAPAPR